jgi:hypothetical protein
MDEAAGNPRRIETKIPWRRPRDFAWEYGNSHHVIACDKREAFAQGSECDEAIHTWFVVLWIASLRSQ